MKQLLTSNLMKTLFTLLLTVTVTEGYTQSDSRLTEFYKKWRAFETPPMYEGAPDYREFTFASRMSEFESLKSELNKIDTSGWSIARKL